MPRIFVSRRVPNGALDPLAALDRPADDPLRLEIREGDDAIRRPELLERAAGADALVVFLSDTVDEELLEAAGPQLRIVANYAVGYDNVDLHACRARGVAVSNTPGVLDDATAAHAMTLLLAAARRVPEGHARLRAGSWSGWKPTELLGTELAGGTLGIVGLGRIGLAFAKRMRGFDMRVRYHNRSRDEDAERQLRALGVDAAWAPDLSALLPEVDALSLHCPLTDATRHLIGADELQAMKSSAILVNTARGAVVDESALVAALRGGAIAAAGLDVFEHEPELHPGLLELDNVVLTPHLGSATVAARTAMGRLCAEAIAAVMAGGTVPHLLVEADASHR